MGLHKIRPLSRGSLEGVTNSREVLGLRLWLVSHEMITSGSPTEQFEICVSGAYFWGIWIPECGGHVTDRHNRLVRCESNGCSCVPLSWGRRVVHTGRVLEKARKRAATLFSPPDLARNPFIFNIKLTAQERVNRWREWCFYTNGWPDLH